MSAEGARLRSRLSFWVTKVRRFLRAKGQGSRRTEYQGHAAHGECTGGDDRRQYEQLELGGKHR